MLAKKQLQQAYDNFITSYSTRKGLNQKSIRNKKQALDKLIPFLDGQPFTADTANEYASYMIGQGWKMPNSQLNIVKNLRAFVSFLFEYDYIEKNFATKIIRPKVVVIPEVLPTVDEAEAVIIAGTEPGKYDHILHKERKKLMRLAMQFALRTGVRGNELINIRGKDLHIDENDPKSSRVYLVAAKGGTPQWQPLPLDMLPSLKECLNDDLVFPVAIKTCNTALRRGAEKLMLPKEINMHVHILRKVFGIPIVNEFAKR